MLELSTQAVLSEPPASPGSSFVELALLLSRRKRLLMAVTAAGVALSMGIAFWMTPLYAATAVIMPPPKAQSLASAMMGQLGSMAGSLSPAFGLKDPADLHIGILKSRTINDELVTRFDLMRVYATHTRTDALKKLARRASFVSGKDSLIQITVEDASPQRAADLANAYVEQLHKQNDRLALTESAQRRLFFQQALEQEKKALADAEDRLKRGQVSTGALQVTTQAEGVIRLIGQLQAEIASREVQLQRLKLSATAQNPEVARQEDELAAVRSQLAKLEAGGGKSRRGDPIIPFARIPDAGLESVRTLRDVKYHEALFEVLGKQFEAARIDEAKDSQAIQVVDAAIPPEKKSWPPRLLLTILGGLTAAILGCAYVFAANSLAGSAQFANSRSSH